MKSQLDNGAAAGSVVRPHRMRLTSTNGYELKDYQQRGVEWLASKTRAGLWDDTGLGKTAIAICAAERAAVVNILVVSPTVALWNWRREFGMWDARRRVQLLDNGKARIDEACNVQVVTHGLLRADALFSQIVARNWSLVIVDEAHEFRGPEAKMTKRLFGLTPDGVGVVQRAERVWHLTATPMLNHAADLWAPMRGIWPELLKSRGLSHYRTFRDRFVIGRFGQHGWRPVANKQSTLPELRAMIDGLYLRRMKAEVLPELPAISFELLPLRPEKLPWKIAELQRDVPALKRLQRSIAERQGALRPGQRLTDSMLAEIELGLDVSSAFKGMGEAFELAEWRRLVGLAKVDPVAQLLDYEIEARQVGKVIVFGHHQDVLHAFADRVQKWKPVLITGDVSAAARSHAVDTFQTDPECRFAVCNIDAAGQAITLTAANEVVFLEPAWVPSRMKQAADRAHRIGQQDRVRVRFVALADTSDELVVDVLRAKTRMIREVLK